MRHGFVGRPLTGRRPLANAIGLLLLDLDWPLWGERGQPCFSLQIAVNISAIHSQPSHWFPVEQLLCASHACATFVISLNINVTLNSVIIVIVRVFCGFFGSLKHMRFVILIKLLKNLIKLVINVLIKL